MTESNPAEQPDVTDLEPDEGDPQPNPYTDGDVVQEDFADVDDPPGYEESGSDAEGDQS